MHFFSFQYITISISVNSPSAYWLRWPSSTLKAPRSRVRLLEGANLWVGVKKTPRLSPHQSTSLRTGSGRGRSHRTVPLCKSGTGVWWIFSACVRSSSYWNTMGAVILLQAEFFYYLYLSLISVHIRFSPLLNLCVQSQDAK
jgi:hypothetical protein